MLEEEKKVERTVLYCSMSLFNIAKDLHNINQLVSQICITLSKNLLASVKMIEMPEVVVHSDSTIHDTKIAQEIEGIIAEIKKEANIE